MNTRIVKHVLLGLAVAAVAACQDSNSVNALFSDATVTDDIASLSGDAIATSLETMLGNEAEAVAAAAAPTDGSRDNTLGYNRTRTCYDAAGAEVAGCRPWAAVRTVVTHVTVDGSRSGSREVTGGRSSEWSGAVHRVIDDTVTRNFDTAEPPAEVSRTHDAVLVGHDTTSFTRDDVSRTHAQASHDKVQGLTWNLPRTSNPFPVAGTISRLDSVHATFTRNGETETRDVVRNIVVTFPADAQGNVELQINDKTCNLNLVTHVVSNCH